VDLVAQVGAGKHIRKIKMLDDLFSIQLILLGHVQLLNLFIKFTVKYQNFKAILKSPRDNPGATAVYAILWFLI
jgi:hypothetical protein